MNRRLANSPILIMLGRIEEVDAFFRARSRAQMLATASPFNTPWLLSARLRTAWRMGRLSSTVGTVCS